MTGLRIAPQLTLPIEAVTETFAILAVKRSGKSNAAVVMAEEMYDHGVPWVAVDPKGDWWGVRAAGGQAPGLSVLVFGGMHGDVPLEPTAGRLVADLIAEQRITCVLDVSEMAKADQRRFLTDFADRLYRRNSEPLHVFCEEADEYIPQRVIGETAKLVGAFEALVKRGGFRGIGITLITQRSASLNKDVLTQAGTLIAMRTPSPQDRKAVLAWIDYHAASRDVIDELPTLEAGEAWVFSPQWLKVLTKIQFRRRRTFDSGATPRVGGKPRPPAHLADVDLAAIKEAMSDTIERAKADDPKALRQEISKLRRELDLERAKPAHEPVVERVEVPVLAPDYAAELESILTPIRHQLNYLGGALAVLKSRPQEGKQGQPTTRSSAPRANQASGTTGRAPVAGPSAHREKNPSAGQGTRPAPADGPPDVQLKDGARRMLQALAAQHPMRLTKAQLATLAKIKHTGGTWSTYWSLLKRHGLVDDTGPDIGITQTGIDAIGGVLPTPQTTEELLAHYRSVLKAGARAMLDVAVDTYPDSVDKADLAELAGITSTGGTFGTYLGHLRRNGLITVEGNQVRASDTLFLGGAS